MAGGASRKVVVPAAMALLIAVLVAASAVNSTITKPQLFSTPSPTVVRAAATGLRFDYIVIILMENHNLCDVYGVNPPCTTPGAGTYETNLAKNYSIPLNDHYCNTNPSLPNYLCLSGANTFGCTTDDNPNSTTCTKAAWVAPNIVDRLVSGGLTWKAYMEDMPSNCYGSNAYPYAVRHNPFVYFGDIVNNPSRCSRVVPAGTNDAVLLGDLASTSAPNYMWLTPNVKNDAHDTNVTYADAYLANLVPQILSSVVFQTQRAALFITYDEGYGPPTFAEWAGPVIKNGYTSSVLYSHYSLLSTIESNWNLQPVNATTDGAAANMNEFFSSAPPAPSASFTYSPTPTYVGDSVSFAASASGGTSPYTYAWKFGDGTTGTGASPAHTYATAGTYTVNLTVTDAASQNGYAQQSVTVDALTGPVARFTLAPAFAQTNAAVQFDASSSRDPNGALQYRWDWTHDGTWDTSYSASATASHAYTAEGTYTVGLEINDTLGLTANATQNVLVDGTPPTTTASLSGTSGNGGWYRSSVQVTLTASDALSGVASTFYRLDGGAWTAYTSAVTVSGDKSHTFDYNSTDRSGNLESTKSMPVKIDTVAPSTTSSLQGTLMPGGYYNGPVNVTLTATDATSGVAFTQDRVDNGAWTTYSAAVTVSGNGSHSLSYDSTDNAGNAEGAHTVTIAIGAASVAPPVTAVVVGQAGSQGWYVSNVTVTLNTSAIPGISIHVQIDGAAWEPYAQPIRLTDGRHTLSYYSLQSSGVNGTVGTTTVNVDTTPPAFTSVSPTGTIPSSEVTVAWTSTDGGSGLARAQVSVDGSSFAVVTANPMQLQLSDGDHAVVVKVVDVAGNIANRTISFRVDTNAFSPTGPLSGVPTYLLIELVAAVGVVLYLRHRGNVRRERAAAKRGRTEPRTPKP